MPSMIQQLPAKAFYLDRLGNMSTSSSISGGSTTSSSSSIPVNSSGGGGIQMNGRKQILTLKPKQPNSYVHHLKHKSKDNLASTGAPVTMLALKKKEKLDKNVVTTLIYRKPSSLISGSTSSSMSSSSDHHHHHLMMAPRRPGSPSSSGYETDSLHDQENCDVFSNLLNYSYDHYDMLHSHPIWSPQPGSDGRILMSGGSIGGGVSYFMENEKSNKFLVQ
uniref:GATA-type domain-containing protein n=1 Tax=Caenorhabditis tropicalis TaxID=1561998 RepID=A0A1I7T4N5_9PELO